MLVVVCVRYAYLSKYRNNNYQINININRIFRGHVEFVFTINFLSSTYIDGTFLLIFFKCHRNYIYYNTVGTDQHISHESRLVLRPLFYLRSEETRGFRMYGVQPG